MLTSKKGLEPAVESSTYQTCLAIPLAFKRCDVWVAWFQWPTCPLQVDHLVYVLTTCTLHRQHTLPIDEKQELQQWICHTAGQMVTSHERVSSRSRFRNHKFPPLYTWSTPNIPELLTQQSNLTIEIYGVFAKGHAKIMSESEPHRWIKSRAVTVSLSVYDLSRSSPCSSLAYANCLLRKNDSKAVKVGDVLAYFHSLRAAMAWACEHDYSSNAWSSSQCAPRPLAGQSWRL